MSRNGAPCSSTTRKLGRTDANDNVGQLGEHKDDAFAQSIGSIGHHQISFLQIKDFQMLTFMAICHFDLCEPTCEQIKGRMDPHDNALGTQTLPMGSINQQDPSQACSDEPWGDY